MEKSIKRLYRKEIIPVYYYIDNNNKIIIDYQQMKEYYKNMIYKLKKETDYTNKNYR